MTPMVTPVEPAATGTYDGEDEATESVSEPEASVIVPPLDSTSSTAMLTPEVWPVAVIAAPETLQTCVRVEPAATLHLMSSETTVPLGMTSVLSKLKVVSEPDAAKLGTLPPVLSWVAPLKSRQELRIPMVSAAALTVIVFMSKVPVDMVIVLPEVTPVTPLQLEGTVVTTTVELLVTLEFILPLMV